MRGVARIDEGPARDGADAERRRGGVPAHHVDGVEGHSDRVGGDLRHGRAMPLPLGRCADRELDPAAGRDVDAGGLERAESGRLDVHREADPDEPAVVGALALPGAHAFEVGLVDGAPQQLGEVPESYDCGLPERSTRPVAYGISSGPTRLRALNSAGSRPSSAARRSIARSIAKTVSGRPAPR